MVEYKTHEEYVEAQRQKAKKTNRRVGIGGLILLAALAGADYTFNGPVTKTLFPKEPVLEQIVKQPYVYGRFVATERGILVLPDADDAKKLSGQLTVKYLASDQTAPGYIMPEKILYDNSMESFDKFVPPPPPMSAGQLAAYKPLEGSFAYNKKESWGVKEGDLVKITGQVKFQDRDTYLLALPAVKDHTSQLIIEGKDNQQTALLANAAMQHKQVTIYGSVGELFSWQHRKETYQAKPHRPEIFSLKVSQVQF